MPTLLVWGKRDPVLPWLIDGRRAAKTLSGSQVVTMPCGHQPHIEMPEAFVKVLEDFLPETTPASP